MLLQQLGDVASADEQCRSMRSSSVIRPRRRRKAVNGAMSGAGE
jgi:hypothetical protein